MTDINQDDDEHISAALALLKFELPDTDLEIVTQSFGQLPTGFHLFRKLPIEIRLKIWRAAFPKKRVIDLLGLKVWETKMGLRLHSQSRTRDPPLPVTLRVNQESRLETLRHYTILYQFNGLESSTEPVGGIRRPICINPAVDCVGFKLPPIFWRYIRDQYPLYARMMENLYIQNPHLFRKIQTLEIRGYSWQVKNHPAVQSKLLAASAVFDLFRLFKHFPALERVHVIQCLAQVYCEKMMPGFSRDFLPLDDMFSYLEMVMKTYQTRTGDFKIPKFYMHKPRCATSRENTEQLEVGLYRIHTRKPPPELEADKQ